ncbi:MAG: 4Fe-4S dicluster domain-containing protein [Firmicutes bacterium]|nr:4Fe-4S dicluster domain-containing protein [Bacillota bacterium]
MRKFESNVQYIKYQVNKQIAKRFLDGEALNAKTINKISEELVDPNRLIRCCVYKERHIVSERVKIGVKSIKKGENVIKIIRAACDECPVYRYVVTEACRGCLAHKCQEVCPRDAITIADHRAFINQNLCIECGKCHDVCPFGAISNVKRPCLGSCHANALFVGEDRKVYIDDEKCVSCGSCVYNCPFGAIVDKSFVLDVLKLIKESENNTKYKVYAIVAPAISSQFTEAKIEQVITGIKQIGFQDVIEAALGADIVACHEAKEFSETIEQRQWMTTSCCPAFVKYVEVNYPELMSHVSGTVSPMIAIAKLIRSTDKDARIVFIGPCTAKKMEINEKDLKGQVDYVITFEELNAIFGAMDIDLTKCEETLLDNASYYGRLFARSGGVTAAVQAVIEEQGIDIPFEPLKCDGLDECVKALKVASFGRLKANLIEGMACKCGCIGGAASLSHGPKDVSQVDKYGALSKEKSSVDATRIFDMEELHLERDYEVLKKQKK